MTATDWGVQGLQKRMQLVSALKADSVDVWVLSLQRGEMVDQMEGNSASSCAKQRRSRTGI